MNKLYRSIPVFVFMVFMLMAFSGCGQKEAAEEYNITGKWSVSFNWGWESFARDVTFNGSKQSGSLTDVFGNTGTYTVNDKSVSWTYAEFETAYTGNFSSTSAMSGTMKQTYEGQTYSGTWTASKAASASLIENLLFNRGNGILSGLREMAGGGQVSELARQTNPIKTPQASQSSLAVVEGYFSVERFRQPEARTGGPWTVTPIDFDSDGDLDVIFVEDQIKPAPEPWGNGLIFAMRNDGQGHFSDATGYVFGGATQVFTLDSIVADFNGDGRQDLYLAEGGTDRDPWPGGQNPLFIQSVDGRLVNETSSRLPAIQDFTHSTTGADIDGDGDVDIYACNVYCQNHKLPYLLINDGQGVFSQNTDRLPKLLTDNTNSNYKKFTGSRFADVDLDDDIDLILGAHPASSTANSNWTERDIILINDGSGYFSYGTLACAPEAFMPLRLAFGSGNRLVGTMDVAVADYNNDGWPDMIMAETGYEEDSKLQLLINNQDGTFRDGSAIPHNFIGSSQGPHSITVCDINQDGLRDLFEQEKEVAGFRIFMNTGNANFIEIHDALGLPNMGWMSSWPGDFDGDGDTDVFGIPHSRYDSAYLFRNLKPYR